MHASPDLTMICLSLLAQIRMASMPGVKAPVYRPATAEAMRLARQAYREVVAMRWREDLRRSVEASARPYRPAGLPQPEDRRRNPLTGQIDPWTGD